MRFIKTLSIALCLTSLAFVSGCSEARYAAHIVKKIPMPGARSKSVGYFKVGTPYKIKGKRYTPTETYEFIQTGMSSWYGPGFHGKLTANGETYNQKDFTAAHRTLQLPSIVRVTNLNNGKSVILRVNDRGPFAHERILDVSEQGAIALGFKNAGITRIRMEVLGDASRKVAEMAKKGIDTKGYEIALNKNPPPSVRSQISRKTPVKYSAKSNIKTAEYSLKPTSRQEAITKVSLSSPSRAQGSVMTPSKGAPLRKPLSAETDQLDAVLKNAASAQTTPRNYVTASNVSNLGVGKIYVQAGSFSQESNALTLSNRLSSYGASKVYMTKVNNKPFFRVRLGPYENRNTARDILTALNANGNKNAVIIID